MVESAVVGSVGGLPLPVVAAWAVYVVGFPLNWYSARFRFCWYHERPWICSPDLIVLFGIGRQILTLGAVVGVWYYHGWLVAALALSAQLAFGVTILRVYYRVHLRQEIAAHLRALKDEGSLDDPDATSTSVILARGRVLTFMRGERLLEPEVPRHTGAYWDYSPSPRDLRDAESIRDLLRDS